MNRIEIMARARAAYQAMTPEERQARKAAKHEALMTRQEKRQRRAILKEDKKERRARRERRKAARTITLQPMSMGEPTYFSLRHYHPLFYCESCKRMRREDSQHAEGLCVDCAGGSND